MKNNNLPDSVSIHSWEEGVNLDVDPWSENIDQAKAIIDDIIEALAQMETLPFQLRLTDAYDIQLLPIDDDILGIEHFEIYPDFETTDLDDYLIEQLKELAAQHNFDTIAIWIEDEYDNVQEFLEQHGFVYRQPDNTEHQAAYEL